MTQRVLLTGGAGFVGSHLAKACLERGWQVGVIYEPSAGLSQVEDITDRIALYPADGTTENIVGIMEKFRPELVFHLASVFLAQHASDDILRLIISNVTFGTQILEAMSLCHVKYFVNTGTSWQHYQNHHYNPVNLYAATKQAFEDILEYYVQVGYVQAITLELFDTYGPKDPRQKLFHLLMRATSDGSRLEMSPGEQLIDMVYIDDVVNAFVIASKRLFDGKVETNQRYAVSSHKPVSLRELVETYQRVTGRVLDIVWGGRSYRNREVMIPWSRGKRLPGWRPIVNLEEGIKKTWRIQND